MINNPENCPQEQLKLIFKQVLTEIMPLYTVSELSKPSVKENIQANFGEYPIQDTPLLIANQNNRRRGLLIYNPSVASTVTIGFLLDQDGASLQHKMIDIAPGKAFELPTSGDGSCYGGNIYAKADGNDIVELLRVTEMFHDA